MKQDREFSTGSVRDTREGKGAFWLLPYHALKRIALRFEQGAKRYGVNNWQKGMPVRDSLLDSASRHLAQAIAGFTNEDHLAAAAWNIMAAMEMQQKVKDGDVPAEMDDIDYLPETRIP